MSDRKRTPLAERIAVSLLLRGYAHAPWITTRLRPTMVAQTWKRATGWRESLIENGRVILGSDADPAALDAYGRGVLESMQRYMEGIAVASRMPTDRLLDRLESVEGLTEFRRHFSDRSGRGIVLLSMHMGEFEPAAAYIGKHVPIHVLYHRDSIGTLERMRTRARRRLGVVGHAVDDGLGTWAGLRDVLGRGEVVALLADRVQPGQRGTPVPVFGRRMEIPIGPFKLAESTGALVVPVFNWRMPGGGLALRMDAPLSMEGDLRGDPGNHSAVRGWVEKMETVIRERPTEWLNVHPVWRDADPAPGVAVESAA
ncbi:MAG: hypothetical protein CMJ34_06395 [Phycisphaerae bacterium]|nr:hypothetical protein [Phycisphaerae bacterium]